MPSPVGAPENPYRSSREHVLDELTWLDAVLRDRITNVRERLASPPDPLAGYVILDSEIDELLAAPPSALSQPRPAPPEVVALRTTIDQRVAATNAAGHVAGQVDGEADDEVVLRLGVLGERFDLDRIDLAVVVCCLAPEVDRRYERLYGYLQDDATRRAPSVDLILSLVCPDPARRWEARRRLGPDGPLVRQGLATVEGEPGRTSVSLLDRTVLLTPRIAGFLLDDDALEPALRPLGRVVDPVVDPVSVPIDPLLPGAPGQRLATLADHAGGRLLAHLWGDPGSGRRRAAQVCAGRDGRGLLVVDAARLATTEDVAESAARVVTEGRLRAAGLYWADADVLLDGRERSRLEIVLEAVEDYPHPVFLATAAEWDVARYAGDRLAVTLAFDPPDGVERARLWRSAIGGAAEAPTDARSDSGWDADAVETELDAADLDALAGTFRLTAGQIAAAVRAARNVAVARDPLRPRLTRDDLDEACRAGAGRTLARVARRVRSRHGWDDLVLPADQRRLLREIADQIRFRSVVHDTWGFADRLTSRGLNLLFAGPPGTGKTMAASVLANTVGVDLYAIDLSATVSKYIGETEKQLQRIFAEAQAGQAMLLFDEADALFGKRTSVRDAHDRYANLETSYLLQKLEDHDGTVILATNLRKNMDDAFVRRLHATIDFPLPGPAERVRIWEHSWPPRAPRHPDVDLEALARTVEVSGGNIRNIVLAAAFLAAADGGVIGMDHLVEATRAEYRKLGTLLTGVELSRESL